MCWKQQNSYLSQIIFISFGLNPIFFLFDILIPSHIHINEFKLVTWVPNKHTSKQQHKRKQPNKQTHKHIRTYTPCTNEIFFESYSCCCAACLCPYSHPCCWCCCLLSMLCKFKSLAVQKVKKWQEAVVSLCHWALALLACCHFEQQFSCQLSASRRAMSFD